MKITIEPTNKLTILNGQSVRVWRGKTDQGVHCEVFVAAVGASTYQDLTEFDEALEEIPAPAEMVPLWNVLPRR